MSLLRLIAFATLVVFAINLGDWPYTDEILDELNEQQAQWLQAESTGGDPASADNTNDRGNAHHGLDFQSQLSLQNVTPPPAGVVLVHSDSSEASFQELHVPRPDFVWDSPFRPPAA